jgi:hypothetical protein
MWVSNSSTAAIATRSAPMVATLATTASSATGSAMLLPNSLRMSSASPSLVTLPRRAAMPCTAMSSGRRATTARVARNPCWLPLSNRLRCRLDRCPRRR